MTARGEETVDARVAVVSSFAAYVLCAMLLKEAELDDGVSLRRRSN